MASSGPRIESTIRAACASGDFVAAASETLRRYGPELLGFLLCFHRDHDEAGEAFSVFSERLWATLPGFRWECSLRTWCYHLARNAAVDLRRGELRRRRGHLGLSSAPEVLAVARKTRTETLSIFRTEKRAALESLRDELSEQDRTLLVLRVDRDLGWREIALVLTEVPSAMDEAALVREAARLRKRFQLVKDRLRSRARERGLLPRGTE